MGKRSIFYFKLSFWAVPAVPSKGSFDSLPLIHRKKKGNPEKKKVKREKNRREKRHRTQHRTASNRTKRSMAANRIGDQPKKTPNSAPAKSANHHNVILKRVKRPNSSRDERHAHGSSFASLSGGPTCNFPNSE